MKITYKKINLELIVLADEADAVIAKLNSALDRLEEEHEIFGGDIETATIEHRGTRRKSALMHTRDASRNAAEAIKKASGTVSDALRKSSQTLRG